MTARQGAKRPETFEVTRDGASIKIQKNARTDLYSTFRVGGPADFLTRTGSAEEIALALRWASEQHLPVTVFGGGSNMLVSDRGIRGLVIVVRGPGRDAAEQLEIVDERPGRVIIRVPAAAPLSWLGKTAAERGWGGMSWAVGLPGNVGGATVNNAGAHGVEMKDNLVSLRCIDEEGEVQERDRDWLEPAYRYTRLKKGGNPRSVIVLDVLLELERVDDPERLKAEAAHNAEYRHATQPTGACAGSIFKNPPGTYSGLLVEQCGLKGTRVGGAVVSDVHANFIVNEDGATAAEIVELMELVRRTVQAETGILLEPEIERVGEW